MPKIDLIPTRCAICGTEGNAVELYPANLDFEAFNPSVFSARRLPDRIHYRMVKCLVCGLVRSDPVASPGLLAQLYAQSTFTYCSEVPNLRRTYGRYLSRLDRYGVEKDALLEIGCGNGFFLEEALVNGYRTVRGIEPSQTAIDQANPRVLGQIVCGLMGPGVFEPEQFDVICLFQVFDHIPDPSGLLDECFLLLRSGGFMLCINHNIDAVSARFLGERNPIIDVEHTFLFNPSTMARLFQVHGFKVRRQGLVWNTYNFFYLTQLLPLPVSGKRWFLDRLKGKSLGKLRLSLPLGNLFLVAQKPDVQLSSGGPKA